MKTEAALCSLGETERFLGESNEISWPDPHCPSGTLALTTYWCLLFWIHVEPRSKVLMTNLWIILSQNIPQSIQFFSMSFSKLFTINITVHVLVINCTEIMAP